MKLTKEKVESLWIVINNKRIKMRIGIVYFPQEKDQDIKEIYKVIKQQVRESAENRESVIVVGDFNCKVGEMVKGNKKEISNGGRKLVKFAEKEGLVIGNAMEICEGTWTREEGKSKSVLDYVLFDEEMAEHIKKMRIHDNNDREISPFHLRKETKGKIKMVYSDHNPIVVETDLVMKQVKTEESTKRRVMTEEGWTKFRTELEKRKVSKQWEDGEDLQVVYEKWCQEIEEVKKKHEEVRKITKKRRSKTLRLLMQEKKKLKCELKAEYKVEIRTKLEELKAQVLEEEKNTYFRKLKKNCEEMRKNGKFSSAGFWKVKKKMESKKSESQHAVRNMKGELVTSNEEILRAYEKYYEDLLTKTNERTKLEENKEIVQKVEDKFNKIMKKASEQEPIQVDRDVIEKVVTGLKKKKARDVEGWNNEMMIHGGEEMILSLMGMVNMVMRKYEIPNQWFYMFIKSIHKKGAKEDLPNKRGLFLTNVISKVFEKVVDEISTIVYNKLQNGGKKKRGTVDIWIVIRALFDEGRRYNKPVYFFFADLVKCFDRLWLKDCLNDLSDCGMREREIGLIYKLNREAHFKVDTPAGMTDEIVVQEIVKQGTVFGPKLCCSSTGKINEDLNEEEAIFPNVIIKALAYVDDLTGGGSRRFVKAVMEKGKEMEKEKLWEFSAEKSNWMCSKQNAEEIEVEVGQGKIERARVYKCLGNMINERGNLDDQLKHMESKAEGVIREGRKICSESRVGKYEFEAKILVTETLSIPAVFYNIETWTKLRRTDEQKLKSIKEGESEDFLGSQRPHHTGEFCMSLEFCQSCYT